MSKRFTITAALPYANGPVHIGHLAGVYISADIFARYQRSKGNDVVFVCGSDEHGVPITIRAQKEGVTPQQVVDKYHNIIQNSFKNLGISFDIYSRTSSQTHHETASDFFKYLYEQGKFVELTSEQFYDPEQNQFLADRYIRGECPKCGAPDAYGDQCEKCGSTLSPDELVNPKSALSSATPIKKETKHWYLPLDQYEAFLKEWILEGHKDWKSNVYGQCKSWLDQGLQPRAVTRDLDWGVPVPVQGADGKVLYVWFDAPIGYISATKDWAKANNKNWEPYWKDQDTQLVHFIGKDNIVFHCVIFPAMLKAHGDYIIPINVPANEFLNLEGNKISTSRNWAVWLNEYLDDMPGKEDVLRYVLCATAPETKDNDFTWKDYQARNNNELVAVLGNFVNRAVVLTHKYFDGKIPTLGSLESIDNDLIAKMKSAPSDIAQSIEQYRFREALSKLMDVARAGNKYLADTEPWKLIKEDTVRTATILNLSLQLASQLVTLMEPFMPFTSQKLASILNTSTVAWDDVSKSEFLENGHAINVATLLFAKVEDQEVESQLQKLEQAKVDNAASQVVATEEVKDEPIKAAVSYDDFAKLDLRTATIIEAQAVPKTEKLLQLTLDLGFEKRTVVSGIAGSYAPEEVVGKQVTLLANLEPRKIRGIMSQGMILMAEQNDGKLIFVNPDSISENGKSIA